MAAKTMAAADNQRIHLAMEYSEIDMVASAMHQTCRRRARFLRFTCVNFWVFRVAQTGSHVLLGARRSHPTLRQSGLPVCRAR
jgi:hypothetical protein